MRCEGDRNDQRRTPTSAGSKASFYCKSFATRVSAAPAENWIGRYVKPLLEHPAEAHGARRSKASVDLRASDPQSRPPGVSTARPKRRGKFWIKQLHTWHWVSAAISLVGMLLFAITGITLNHAGSISATPTVVASNAVLPPELLAQLGDVEASNAPLPAAVAAEAKDLVDLDASGRPGEWSDEEVYVALTRPGGDGWISIDRATGAIESERTDRGWISYFNDLHKGRNAGSAWFWFIDIFAVACVVFTITGLLLLQLHAKNRPTTWPMVGFGFAIPAVIAIFFIH